MRNKLKVPVLRGSSRADAEMADDFNAELQPSPRRKGGKIPSFEYGEGAKRRLEYLRKNIRRDRENQGIVSEEEAPPSVVIPAPRPAKTVIRVGVPKEEMAKRFEAKSSLGKKSKINSMAGAPSPEEEKGMLEELRKKLRGLLGG